MSHSNSTASRSARASTALFGAAWLVITAPTAAAHFLWAAVDAGPQPKVRVSFGEEPVGPTEGVPLTKLDAARAWDGKGRPITLTHGSDSLSGALAPETVVAAAAESWGVVDRSEDGTGAFLLEYYAKGASTLADAAAGTKLGFEVFARRDGNQLLLSLRRGETVVPDASVKIHLPSGESLDRASDAKGEVRIDAAQSGIYGVRARWIEPRAGTVGEKKFGEVRHYSTLTFQAPAMLTAVETKVGEPIAAAAKKADPEAYALLKSAHDSRQVLPADYPGFRCAVVLRDGDRTWDGTLVYRKQGETEIHLEGVDEATLGWARGQVLNLTGHRRGGDFAQGDGKYPLELAPDDANPYGRLIEVNDASKSSYRVRDNKVLEVTRTMEGSRFTISVIDTMEGDTGKYMANHFVVSYRDAASGVLQKFEGYRDSYAHVDGLWLPTSRTVITVADATSPSVRTLRLRNHTRLDPQEGQKAAVRD